MAFASARAPARASSTSSGAARDATVRSRASRSGSGSAIAAARSFSLWQSEPGERGLDALQPLLELVVTRAVALAQPGIGLPPVDAHLARGVDRRDEQSQLDRQELDVDELDGDVAGDDDALVEDPFEEIGQVR